jgi:ketosteroid isomerase-like protein
VSPIGYNALVSDYTSDGAIPVEDAVSSQPPTVDEVEERQRERYPQQAATALHPSAPGSGHADGRDAFDRFVHALRSLEESGNCDGIVECYSDDAVVGSVQAAERLGKEGAKEFWTEYLANLGGARSSFLRVIVDGDSAALEWKTDLVSGSSYSGVTLLDCIDGKIGRSWAYFNPHSIVC